MTDTASGARPLSAEADPPAEVEPAELAERLRAADGGGPTGAEPAAAEAERAEADAVADDAEADLADVAEQAITVPVDEDEYPAPAAVETAFPEDYA